MAIPDFYLNTLTHLPSQAPNVMHEVKTKVNMTVFRSLELNGHGKGCSSAAAHSAAALHTVGRQPPHMRLHGRRSSRSSKWRPKCNKTGTSMHIDKTDEDSLSSISRSAQSIDPSPL